MPSPPRTIFDRAAAALADWMFLGSGLLMLALALVMPAWLSCQDLAWQRDLMRVQAARLSDQQARYHDFYVALKADDPILLERLAFTQLGYQVAGKHVLDLPDGAGTDRQADLIATSASIDRWLVEPMPRLGVDAPRHERINTKLTRVTTTPELRAGLIAAAVACLGAGLWPRRGDADDDPAAQAQPRLKVRRA